MDAHQSETMRQDILDRMQQVMGELPDRSNRMPLEVRVEEERQSPGLVWRKITFVVDPEDRCSAWLIMPESVDAPCPAMLCLHQTTRIGKDEPAGLGGNANFHYALELAQRGYVTLAPDYPNFGDYKVDLYAQGYASATMKGIWNHMRAVDLLAELPEVDPDRIGCIGHSLGGHNTLFLAAFDTRLKVAVTSCGFTRFTWNDDEGRGTMGDLADWSHAGYMPRIADRYGCRAENVPFDFDEVLAVIAPRTLFVTAPTRDFMRCEGAKECVELMRPVYARAAAPDRLVSVHPDCRHDFPPDARQQAYDLIDRSLHPAAAEVRPIVPESCCAARSVGALNVRMDEPVVVATSAPGETRWGYFQFPAISRLPDGRLVVTHNVSPDRSDAYGRPGPAFVSSDEGRTWSPFEADDPMLTVSHAVASPVLDGEFLCAPYSPVLDIDPAADLPPTPCREVDAYGKVDFYLASGCAPRIGDYMSRIPATRWSPSTGTWKREELRWDVDSALVRIRYGEDVVTRSYLDNPLVRVGNHLYYPDYHTAHLLPDGSAPKNFACWLMRSDDNGRTWTRRGLIAHDATGELMMAEPTLVHTADDGLACVIRCAHHEQKPMLITYSKDGDTWDPPVELYPFGVMPQSLALPNGVTVLSFGRPGVHLMFSADGLARSWTLPVALTEADSGKVAAHSCGYTRLLPLDDNSFLIAYSHFQWPNPAGGTGKAILTRRIELMRGVG